MGHPNHPNTWNLSTLRVFPWGISIANWHETSKSSWHLKSFDVTVIFHEKYQLKNDIRHPNHHATWNLPTLRDFSWGLSIANSHETSKSSEHLKSFDVTVIFHEKYQLKNDMRHPNHPNTWNLSTLRLFFMRNINWEMTLDIQIIMILEIFRRYGYFREEYQLQTHMRHPNHPNTWNLSTLRVFSGGISIANWHETSKSSEHLKSSDVTGFFVRNIDCKLTWDIQIIMLLEIFRRYGYFSWEISIQKWH